MEDVAHLVIGDQAPGFQLPDQHKMERSLEEFGEAPVLLYFYPKASTPGCTTQACSLRDIAGTIGEAQVIGISLDTPRRQMNFDTKYELEFPLLSDPDHLVAEAYGVWQLKKLYGREYMGIVRSAFLIDGRGAIAAVFYKISPKDTANRLLGALEAL